MAWQLANLLLLLLANFKLDHLPNNLANNAFTGGDTKSKHFLFNLHSVAKSKAARTQTNHCIESSLLLLF